MVERKNGWQLAEQAGEQTPDGMQRLLATAGWDADAVRDDLRTSVVEHLGDPAAGLVVDETGFLKKGDPAAGVQRQDSGTAGRIEHCQIGVFLADAAPAGRAFLDRDRSLPEAWVDDAARREEAAVPPDVAFRSKPPLARAMLERAVAAGGPAGWVTGDAVDGGDRRRRVWLEERDVPHVLAVKRTEPLWAATVRGPAPGPAAARVATLPAAAWARLSAGDGATGPRLDAWARGAIRPLADPDRGAWLLGRRSLADPTDRAHDVCSGPADATRADLVRVAGTRWAVEEVSEAAKGEVGLDQDEVRRWAGWSRHVTRGLLAHADLAVTRARAAGTDKGGGASLTAALLPPTVPAVRRLLCRLVWGRPPPPDQALGWSVWRRRHQARAKRGHDRRRLARLREHVRL